MLGFGVLLIFFLDLLNNIHASDVAIVAYSRDSLCIGVELVREYPLSCVSYQRDGAQQASYRYECNAQDGSLALYSYEDSHCSRGSALLSVIHSSASDIAGTCTATTASPYLSSQLLCGQVSENALLSLMPRIFDHRRVVMRHFDSRDEQCSHRPVLTQMWAEDTCVFYPSADPTITGNSTGVYAIFNVEIVGSRRRSPLFSGQLFNNEQCSVWSDDDIPEEDDGIGVPTRRRLGAEDRMVNYDVPMDVCEVTMNGAFGVDLLDNDLTSYTTIHLSYPGDIYAYFLGRSTAVNQSGGGKDGGLSVLLMVAVLGGLFAAVAYGAYIYVTDIAPDRRRRNMSLLPQESSHSSHASEIGMLPLHQSTSSSVDRPLNDDEEEATV